MLRRIRAATPRPGVDLELVHAKKRLSVLRARLGASHSRVTPGSLRAEGGKLLVACADRWLELAEVRLAGRRAMPAEELLRGLKLADGERAESP